MGTAIVIGLGSAASILLSMYNGNSNWKYSLLGTLANNNIARMIKINTTNIYLYLEIKYGIF